MPPTPGIELGPPGWKPGILAIRPRGIAIIISNVLIINSDFDVKNRHV